MRPPITSLSLDLLSRLLQPFEDEIQSRAAANEVCISLSWLKREKNTTNILKLIQIYRMFRRALLATGLLRGHSGELNATVQTPPSTFAPTPNLNHMPGGAGGRAIGLLRR